MTRTLASAHCLVLAVLLLACGRDQPSPQTHAAPQALPAAPALSAAAARGQAGYAKMCAVCHGAAGEGYKADQAPALAHPEFLASVTDDFLRSAILEGRANTTMSAWGRSRGGPLTRADADELVAFLRSWQKTPRAALDERPLTGDVARGRDLFERECQRCHGASGAGGPNIHLTDAGLLTWASNGFMRHAISRGRSGTAMPAYGATLGAQGVDDVIAFLRNASRPAAPVLPPEPPKPPPLPLGKIPLHPRGPAPVGFNVFPQTTRAEVIHAQMVRGARMALLDARASSDYTNEHITGAVSVPFYDPSPYLAQLPKDTWLVCYCACPHAESGALAQKLLDAGFTKVTVLDEGLGFWKSKGYPTATGSGAEEKK